MRLLVARIFTLGRPNGLALVFTTFLLTCALLLGAMPGALAKIPTAKPKLDPLSSTMSQPAPSESKPSTLQPQPVSNAHRAQQHLDTLEMALLGMTQPDKPVSDRLDQLETLVFGQPTPVPANILAKVSPSLRQEKAVGYRLDRLQKQLNRFQPQTASQPQGTPPPNAPPNQSPNSPSGVQAPGTNPAESDYPAVTQIEQQLFGQTFAKEDVTVRLNRIETKIYGKPMAGALADRVDRLRPLFEASAPPVYTPPGYSPPPSTSPGGYPPSGSPPPANLYGYQGNTTAPPPSVSNPYVNSMPPIQGDPQILYAIDSIEQRIFKYTYPMDTVSNRLDRLEIAVFQTKAPPGVSDQERIDRLQAVHAVADDQRANGGRAYGRRSTIQTLLPFLIMSLLIAL